MKIKNIIICLTMLFAVVGCFKDEGNYDYKTLQNIKLSIVPVSSTVIGEDVEFEVKLQFPEGYSSEFKYEWSVEGKSRGENAPKTVWKSDTLGTDIPFGVVVTDLKTGAIYAEYKYVTVKPLFQEGFLVLTEDGSNTDMHFILSDEISGDKANFSNDSTVFTREILNVFKNNTKETYPGKPVRISEHYMYDDYGENPDNEITLEIDEDGRRNYYALNGSTLAKEVSIKQEFVDEILPENFNPKKIVHTSLDSYIINEDGYVYQRRSASNAAYHVGLFEKDLRLWGKAKLSDIMLTHYKASSMLLAIEEDAETKKRNYVGIVEEHNGENYNSMRLPQLEPHKDFLDVKDEIVFSDFFKLGINTYRVGEQAVILKNSAGEYILHLFRYKYYRGESMSFTDSKKINLTQKFGITEVKGMFTGKMSEVQMVYFYDSHKVYCYQSIYGGVAYDDTRDLFSVMKEYPDKTIAAVGGKVFTTYEEDEDIQKLETHIAIGFEDGSLEIQMMDCHNLSVFIKKVFENKANYGKIVQIHYKEGGNCFFQ